MAPSPKPTPAPTPSSKYAYVVTKTGVYSNDFPVKTSSQGSIAACVDFCGNNGLFFFDMFGSSSCECFQYRSTSFMNYAGAFYGEILGLRTSAPTSPTKPPSSSVVTSAPTSGTTGSPVASATNAPTKTVSSVSTTHARISSFNIVWGWTKSTVVLPGLNFRLFLVCPQQGSYCRSHPGPYSEVSRKGVVLHHPIIDGFINDH